MHKVRSRVVRAFAHIHPDTHDPRTYPQKVVISIFPFFNTAGLVPEEFVLNRFFFVYVSAAGIRSMSRALASVGCVRVCMCAWQAVSDAVVAYVPSASSPRTRTSVKTHETKRASL